ncbi:sensor histidine kinase [Paenibacillus sp. MBLB4367]|uniref:sensor histidine kinase n=1 Tax=Paenibacillus sp. MBLB4367 TaxID=3384767 RepID=UPI0039081009
MKLMYRLQLSFGLLLIGILAVAAAVIYPLMLDTLVEGQRKEMREQASAMMPLTEALPVTPAIPAGSITVGMEKLQGAFPAGGKTDAVWIEPNDQVLYSTLSPATTSEWIRIWRQTADFQNALWLGKDDKYIVEAVSFQTAASTQAMKAGTLIMATPISKIKSMQMALFQRMMILLTVGGIAAYALSMIMAKRLVIPLAKLRNELGKVGQLRFSEVRLVRTGGEIGEVAQGVYRMANELNAYHTAQKQFFQNASHELKTPLMAIQGYAEGIRDGVFAGESASKGLNVIVDECDRLKKIVTEMILLAKLESEEGIFHPEPVRVADLITETVERIHPLYASGGLRIQTSVPPGEEERLFIQADREKLLQAMLNIAGNAVRYAKETVRIHAGVEDDWIAIEIADDGEGIPESLLPQLFHRFVKGKDGETGLGLSISRAIVERSGGSITAHNLPTGGAAFVLRFPKARSGKTNGNGKTNGSFMTES